MTRRIAILLALASALIGTCLAGVAGAAPTVVDTTHHNLGEGRLTIEGLKVTDTSHLLFHGTGVQATEHELVATQFELKLLARYSTGHSDLAAHPCPTEFHIRHQQGAEISWDAPRPVPTVYSGYHYLPQFQEIVLLGAPLEAQAVRLCWYLHPKNQYGRWLALESLVRF